jgi:succinate dehydrogenase/fumarate reductase flavoprotein subunit
LSASLEGANVVLIESTEFVGGTTATSAATSWVPGTKRGLEVNPEDSPERVKLFLDKAVGQGSDPQMRQAFIDHGPQAIQKLEEQTALQFQVRQLHPDYLSELEGSVLRGRAIEPQPFDGKLLGPNLGLVRPPIPEFTVLDGMMVDRDDIFHLLRLTQNWKSFKYSARIIARHMLDKIIHPRSTRLVMGNAMIARMLYSYIQKGGQLLTRCEVTSFLHNEDTVTGVSVSQTQPNGTISSCTIKSKAGVILASGGFNKHPIKRPEMLPGIPKEWSPAAPGHTGKMQDLALELGATLGSSGSTHAFWAPVSIRKRKDSSVAAFPHFVMDRGKPGMISVDSNGKRFMNESTSYHLFGLAMQEHHKLTPCIPTWLICDAPALQRYGLGMIRPGGSGLKAFLNDGYLKTGHTLVELAQALNIPASNLESTISRFNQFAKQGIDEDFQRGSTDYQRANGDATWTGKNPCLGGLSQGPFYAIALYPGDIGASTGLVANTNAQVLHSNASPINGLYACGNEMQSIMGNVYPAPGITIGPAVTFGYIAANHALSKVKMGLVDASE